MAYHKNIVKLSDFTFFPNFTYSLVCTIFIESLRIIAVAYVMIHDSWTNEYRLRD